MRDREHLHLMADALVKKFGDDAPAVAERQAAHAEADAAIADVWAQIASLARASIPSR